MAGLATPYEVNSDTTRFTFYLRGHPSPRGMKLPTLDDLPADLRHGHQAAAAHSPAHWSDGLTITAYDFAYSWKRMVAPETAAPMAPVYSPPLKNAETMKPDHAGCCRCFSIRYSYLRKPYVQGHDAQVLDIPEL